MKILVIDDNQDNINSALQSLSEHEVTICMSHDEALWLLQINHDLEKKSNLISLYMSQGLVRYDAVVKACKESQIPYWDAVLCDLLMPAGTCFAVKERNPFIGQEMPVGWSLALAAVRRGAKYVAVITDINHHNHPASAMLDTLKNHIFQIDGARLLFSQHTGLVGKNGKVEKCTKCDGAGNLVINNLLYDCDCHGGVVYEKQGKHWGFVLEQLVSNSAEERLF